MVEATQCGLRTSFGSGLLREFESPQPHLCEWLSMDGLGVVVGIALCIEIAMYSLCSLNGGSF